MNKSSLTEFSIRVGKCCSINLENISLHSDTKPVSGCPDLLCSLSRLAWNEKSTYFHSTLRQISFYESFHFNHETVFLSQLYDTYLSSCLQTNHHTVPISETFLCLFNNCRHLHPQTMENGSFDK